jgi:hypothetical protein
MRVAVLAAASALLLATGACRKAQPIEVAPDPELADVPVEKALEILRKLLPSAEYLWCTNPKESYKPTDLKEWSVGKDVLRVVPVKEKYPTFVLNYADLTSTRLDKQGRYFTAKVFAKMQPDPNKEYLAFQWKTQEPAEQVVKMFESIRLKK